MTYAGLEALALQAGSDLHLVSGVEVGAFVAVTVGRYGSERAELGDTAITQDIRRRAAHQWLFAGLRLRFLRPS